jgi:SAM-dependent methyltransferase
MYLTKNIKQFKNQKEYFDWESYFAGGVGQAAHTGEMLDAPNLSMKNHLQENPFHLTLVLSRMMLKLFQGLEFKIDSPRILELGAGTGFLTRWLISRYKGSGVLVDSSKAAYEEFLTKKDPFVRQVNYINQDIFTLNLEESFDLVCSFGLIEHFKDKKAVIDVHKKFIAPGGWVLILVPLDTPQTRLFFEVHMELNFGYRELLTLEEFKGILKEQNLEVTAAAVSQGYVYDFAAAACREWT